MKKLLITGADSFIGTHVREYLSKFPGEFCVNELDMRTEAWRNADMSAYDAVLHVAGIAHVSPKAQLAPLYRSVNCRLAIETAAAAAAAGVGQFIFLSSMIVYGQATPIGCPEDITEHTAPAPVNEYGQSKLDAEQGIKALEGAGFRTAILRPPMIYGPGCKGNYNALVRFSKRFPVFPALENRRSALYIENLCEFIRLLLLSGQGGTFFPRDGQPVSTTQFMRCIAACNGKKIVFTRVFNPLLRLFGRVNALRRAFGSMAYADTVPDWPENYRVCTFEEAIYRTERANRG